MNKARLILAAAVVFVAGTAHGKSHKHKAPAKHPAAEKSDADTSGGADDTKDSAGENSASSDSASSDAPPSDANDESTDAKKDANDESPAGDAEPADRDATEASESKSEKAEALPEELPAETPRFARLWVGVAGTVDLVFMPNAGNLCTLGANGLPLNGHGAYCTNPDDSDFPARGNLAQNAALVPGASGQLNGGAKAGDIRAMIAVDYAFTKSILVGARVGYVANGYPGSAGVNDGRAYGHRFHGELRATYVFGESSLSRVGFAPMAFVGGGVAQFDGHDSSFVALRGIRGTQPVDIWITSGPGFVVAGGGARYQFSPRIAATLAARLNLAFGPGGALFTYGPEVAVQYGF
jgi:hypothetical protein